MMKRILVCLLALLICQTAVAQAEFDFPDVFLPVDELPVRTENSYVSPNVSITITASRVLNSDNKASDVYVADIYVRELSYFQRYFGGGEWDKQSLRIPQLAEASGALIGITGDNAHDISLKTVGWVMGNGELLCDKTNKQLDLGLLYKNGEMTTILKQDLDYEWLETQKDDIWHIFCFGPALLDADGNPLGKYNSQVNPKNPRSVVGYFEPGHYCFVIIDGRGTKSKLDKGTNHGMKMQDVAEFMQGLGCKQAYNLDGGRSAAMWFGGTDILEKEASKIKVISNPQNNGRKVGDILIIVDPLSEFAIAAEPAATEEPASK